jgi:hypothetical protein
MSRMQYGIFAFGLALGSLAVLPSCGHEQVLVGITVEPKLETFGATNIPLSEDAGLSVQLRAKGSYEHPPVIKDITDKVTWTSNTPDMVAVDPNTPGLIAPTGNACGDTLISATIVTNESAGGVSSSGAQISGTMTATVVCPGGN